LWERRLTEAASAAKRRGFRRVLQVPIDRPAVLSADFRRGETD
jgi:hypothetical protein